MGRGRKGNKQNSNATRKGHGSGEEEKISVSRRRGRPQKSLKDDTEEVEEAEKVEDDGKISNGSISNRNLDVIDSGQKRKRSDMVKEILDLAEKENNVEPNTNVDDSTKSSGYRRSGHRRKNKPQRAAEAVVECK